MNEPRLVTRRSFLETGAIITLGSALLAPKLAHAGVPFNLYEFIEGAQYAIPVQQFFTGIDYVPGASQIMIATVPNVLAGDILECDAAIGLSQNGGGSLRALPYAAVVGASIVLYSNSSPATANSWGIETFGEDITPERPYLTVHQHVIYQMTQNEGDVQIALRVYCGSAAQVQQGDAIQEMFANGQPTGHLYVKRYPAQ